MTIVHIYVYLLQVVCRCQRGAVWCHFRWYYDVLGSWQHESIVNTGDNDDIKYRKRVKTEPDRQDKNTVS